jgi:hypothetical protein
MIQLNDWMRSQFLLDAERKKEEIIGFFCLLGGDIGTREHWNSPVMQN